MFSLLPGRRNNRDLNRRVRNRDIPERRRTSNGAIF
jgi:hypothetical protein